MQVLSSFQPQLDIVGDFVFWYPIIMGLLWMIGSIFYYFRVEFRSKKPTLPEQPLVSVLVPTFNEEKQIREVIENLEKLDYPNYEIIIINDGSTDRSAIVEHKLVEQYPNTRFIDLKENKGKANALYLGYLAARGEYLMCVDGDSYLDPDCITYMVRHFVGEGNERVGAVTGNPKVRNRSSLLARIQLCEYCSIIGLIKRAQRIFGSFTTVSGVVVCYRKKALESINLWDRDIITEDIAVTWKLQRASWRVRYESHALCWMLVPETLKGLIKQRMRWAQGGQQTMGR